MNLNNNVKREAPESMNGFFYQRYCCINQILEKNNYDYEYVVEEGYEDIDFININKNREIIQIKYYGDKNESLTYNSGLYKVIMSNYNNINIDNIVYYAYNKNKNIFKENLINVFNNKQFYNIGKYIILLLYKECITKEQKKKNNKIELNFDITDIETIDGIYNTYIKKIKKKFKNNDKYKLVFDFFDNENNCNTFFKKFKLCEGKSFKDLNNEIDFNIKKNFNNFVNTNNEDNMNLRIFLIKNTILNILTDKMFENLNSKDRQIKYDEILKIVNSNIKIFTNPDNLYFELLKQTEKIITNSFKHKQIEQLNINDYIEQIKNININSLDNISFCICLLNKYYSKLNENDVKNIKNYLIKFIIDKYNFTNNDTENNFKIISYLNNIKNQTNNDKRYRIANKNIIKLIDENYNVNKYFESIKNKKILKD